ncbi:MAG: archaellin/type IV pilin N-terminal domain-containing protein [Thermoplasmata archaeon]
MSNRRWRRGGARGVAPIIATILLLAMTLVIFTLLFSFKFITPPSPPTVSFVIHSGGSNPVWGDGTDTPGDGTYSLLNTTQIIISSVSPTNIPLSAIEFSFICDNSSTGGNSTVLVQGSLAEMTWFPGLTSSPPAGAPTLGWCASFHAGGYGGGSFSTYYNRLGLFIPVSSQTDTLQAGDTFLLYIHNGGYPLDYGDTANDCNNHVAHKPCLDGDDYHGAPPWCFTNPGSCTINLEYTGSPVTSLASIPVYSLAPPSS